MSRFSALIDSIEAQLNDATVKFIDDHPALKPVVRAGLLPAVGLSTATGTTFGFKLAMACSVVLASALAAVWLRRRAARDA